MDCGFRLGEHFERRRDGSAGAMSPGDGRRRLRPHRVEVDVDDAFELTLLADKVHIGADDNGLCAADAFDAGVAASAGEVALNLVGLKDRTELVQLADVGWSLE
jgi:hypothetical protein